MNGVVGLALLLALASPPPTDDHAVVVGVGDYLDPALTDLSGAADDAREMRATLVEALGFAPADIALLVDHEATRDAILRALYRAVARLGPGDRLVFFFSGHGARVFDASGDEPDGWDEGLVPFDSGRDGRPNRDLLDDEIAAVLEQVAARGARAVLIFDNCHAGTGARADAVRAAPDDARPLARPWLAPPPTTGEKGLVVDDRTRGWTLLAAAREDQLAFEKPLAAGRMRGLFTWNLTRALRVARSTDTWRDVMARTAASVVAFDARQHPQLEGRGMDDRIFAPGRRPRPASVTVRATGTGRVTLDVGVAHGIDVGARFTLDGGAEARVVDVGAVQSVAEIPPGVTVAPDTRAVLVDAGERVPRVPVYAPPGTGLVDSLAALPGVELVEQAAAARIRVQRRAGQWHVTADDETPLGPPVGPKLFPLGTRAGGGRVVDMQARGTLDARLAEALQEIDAPIATSADGLGEPPDGIAKPSGVAGKPSGAIQMPSRRPKRAVRTHRLDGPPSAETRDAVVGRVRTWTRWFAVADLATRTPPSPMAIEWHLEVAGRALSTPIELGDGDRFDLVVANHGATDAYVNVLALGDDGAVTVVYPLPGVAAYVPAFGEWRQAAEAGLPSGRARTVDRLLLVTTSRPADFRVLEQGHKGLAAWGDPLKMATAAGPGERGLPAVEWDVRALRVTTAR